jgi:hypothetical protein
MHETLRLIPSMAQTKQNNLKVSHTLRGPYSTCYRKHEAENRIKIHDDLPKYKNFKQNMM